MIKHAIAKREALAFPLFLWFWFGCGFSRRGIWFFYLALSELWGRAGAPTPPGLGRLPQDPAKPTKAYSPAFCARSFGSAHLSWPSSLAGRAPGGRCGPFLFFAKSPPRSFSLAPLAPSNKVEMARKAARLLPCPDEILPGGPRWDLGCWYWGRVFARPWAGCRVRPCAGGAAGRSASPKPGPPARASCLAGRGPCPPAAKRRPPGAAPRVALMIPGHIIIPLYGF